MSIQCVNGKRVLVKCYPYDLANINEILKQVDAIGYRAFDGTDLLTEINIPENVNMIKKGAFANTGLTEVLLNPRTEVLDQVFDKEVRISYRKMSDLYLLNEINEIVKSNDKISNHFKEEVDRLIVHMIARAKEENKSEAIEKNINSDNTTFTYIMIDRL